MLKWLVVICLLMTGEVFSMQEACSRAWEKTELVEFAFKCRSVARQEKPCFGKLIEEGNRLACMHEEFFGFIYSNIERALNDAYESSEAGKEGFSYSEVYEKLKKLLQDHSSQKF